MRRVDSRPCVYFIQIGDVIKIGASNFFQQRVNSYPPTRKILHVQYTPDAWTLEKEYHLRFGDHLAAGNEWFRDHQNIRDFITELQLAG